MSLALFLHNSTAIRQLEHGQKIKRLQRPTDHRAQIKTVSDLKSSPAFHLPLGSSLIVLTWTPTVSTFLVLWVFFLFLEHFILLLYVRVFLCTYCSLCLKSPSFSIAFAKKVQELNFTSQRVFPDPCPHPRDLVCCTRQGLVLFTFITLMALCQTLSSLRWKGPYAARPVLHP